MGEWRCRQCNKLLGMFARVIGVIICPRCGSENVRD
jgi:phage FluMu protein Com